MPIDFWFSSDQFHIQVASGVGSISTVCKKPAASGSQRILRKLERGDTDVHLQTKLVTLHISDIWFYYINQMTDQMIWFLAFTILILFREAFYVFMNFSLISQHSVLKPQLLICLYNPTLLPYLYLSLIPSRFSAIQACCVERVGFVDDMRENSPRKPFKTSRELLVFWPRERNSYNFQKAV